MIALATSSTTPGTMDVCYVDGQHRTIGSCASNDSKGVSGYVVWHGHVLAFSEPDEDSWARSALAVYLLGPEADGIRVVDLTPDLVKLAARVTGGDE